jgi:hypothetical protein
VEYEPAQIVTGPEAAIYSTDRAEVRIYSLADLLQGNSGWFTTRSGTNEQLCDLIKATISPEGWRDNGGRVGSTRWIGDRLVITATPGMHWQVERLLDALRRN